MDALPLESGSRPGGEHNCCLSCQLPGAGAALEHGCGRWAGGCCLAQTSEWLELRD